jgi:hypothetical protein|tara:strand:- start:3676 stop:4461 length:786 start_codon:yes stop_codon:yes gene_type:complete
MQYVPRYLLNNRTSIIANDSGFITEYRPVYQNQLQIYKGIDNVLQFRLLNADQKPIDTSDYTPKFQAFDENKKLIISHDGVNLDDGSSQSRGLFTVTVTESDLLNVLDQYLSYSIHLVDANGKKKVSYTDTHFNNSGTINISSSAFPGPNPTYSVTSFTQVTENTPYWVTESLDAEPGINGNEALHTITVYTDNYIGDVIVQGTLDNQIADNTNWADITSLSFTGSETEPVPANFNGVFTNLRFKASVDPASKISKILVRN